MGEFIRSLPQKLIDDLKLESLYTNCLLQDIQLNKNAVFPAIRNNYISFYYKGGNIFNYSKSSFRTHMKYGVIPYKSKSPYIKEEDLADIAILKNFSSAYSEIKNRCKLYGGKEAEYVSALYTCSIAKKRKGIILLDTEICFDSRNDNDLDPDTSNKKQNRIDILLYNIDSRQLCFCEAKHFSNSELWAKAGNKPKVCQQIKSYNGTIQNRSVEILNQYKEYVNKLNILFGTSLPVPESLFPETGLLLFGFDQTQREKIRKLLIEDNSLEDINYYMTGQLKSNQISTLYNAITK